MNNNWDYWTYGIIIEQKKKPFYLKKNKSKYQYQPHPRCDEFETASLKASLTNREITFSARYKKILSYSTILKVNRIKCCSCYYATDSLLRIGSLVEQNFLIQVLNSAIFYVQNNYDISVKKLWIEKFNVETYSDINQSILLNHSSWHPQTSSSITIKLGFRTDSKIRVRMRRGRNLRRK